MTRNVVKPVSLEIHLLRSCWSYSSSALRVPDPTPNSPNISRDGLTVETIHASVIKSGRVQYSHVGNYLLGLYVKSQHLGRAQNLFDEISARDVRSWTILISGFARNGCSEMALSLFNEMQKEGIGPNHFTFSCILKCCSNVNGLRFGKAVHGWVTRYGVDLDIALANSFLDFYVKCGLLIYAEQLFELMAEKDTVSWNIMIGSYLQFGDTVKSLDFFRKLSAKDVVSWNTIIDGHMRNGREGTAISLLYQMAEIGPQFNEVTYTVALVLVASLSILELGKQIHGRLLRVGIHDDGFVRCSLIDMYCKCGQMDKASFIFHNLSQNRLTTQSCDVYLSGSMVGTASWSSMVAGYIQNGRLENALKIFGIMIFEQVEVDKFTLTSIVSACAKTGLLEFGQQIHAHILKIGHKLDVFLASSMIDMYAKCGKLNDAWLVFRRANVWNVVLWTSMISGFALHGKGKEAISHFEMMRSEGIRPNEVSFVGILTACSHAGLLKEGWTYFRLMKEVYGIKPGVEHFTCMVDLLGRAGCFSEVKDFIYKNGISHLSSVWRAFLSSCRVHKDAEMARWVAEKLLELEPFEAETYILFSNTCATKNRWEEAANVRGLMQERGIKKVPGQSWIQLKNQVHTFVMGDRSHPQEPEIYSYLNKLVGELKEIGYSTDINTVMQDVEEEQKEVLLGFHSEKLAIAYGLISTSSGTPIQVMKNLRICTDCHSFIKYTSHLLSREIIVRDIRRFHHFKNGCCSCGDYW